jgi:hypothetical protein
MKYIASICYFLYTYLTMFTLKIIALSLEFSGTLMIAFTALRVHHRVLREHKIDKDVFRVMRREQYIGIIGAAMVTTGFLLNIFILLVEA